MKFLVCISLALIFAAAAHAQCTTDAGYVCITQAAANKSAATALELVATKNEIQVLKEGLAAKDRIIADVQAGRNEAVDKLKDANGKLANDLAEKTGEIIQCNATNVRDSALIDFLVKNQRSKQNGLINVKLGGN